MKLKFNVILQDFCQISQKNKKIKEVKLALKMKVIFTFLVGNPCDYLLIKFYNAGNEKSCSDTSDVVYLRTETSIMTSVNTLNTQQTPTSSSESETNSETDLLNIFYDRKKEAERRKTAARRKRRERYVTVEELFGR